jgi:N-carbamoylputrescine amidase
MTEKRTVKIGIVQMSMSDSREENKAKAIRSARALAADGAQIICFSELFLGPYFCQTKDEKFFDLAEVIPGNTSEEFSALAKELGAVIIASLYEHADGKRFNTAIVCDADGTYLGKYRKMHIPDDPAHGFGETFYFEHGDLGFKVFDTRFGKIAPMICWDQWFPEGARIAAASGAEILFYPTAIGWNDVVDPKPIQEAEHEAWQTIQRSHAIANGVFVVAVNRIGTEGDLRFWGTSFVSDPYGRFVAKFSHDEEESRIVSIELPLIDEMRSSWPFLECRRVRYDN